MASRKIRCKDRVVANIPSTDEAGFTRDGIMNSYNTHMWADDNPYTTVAPRDQHPFSIHFYVGILGDKPLRPVVLPNI
jgi:hypothetical protein